MEFFDAILGFPTVLFTVLLVLVIAYWLVVLLGGADHDLLDVGHGLLGAPVAVGLSVLVPVAWLVSLAGASVTGGALPRVAVLLVALAAGWLAARLAAIPLRRLTPATGGGSRTAFVGRSCVIRTGTVTESFGQAEVTADDGSSAIVQVRQTGADTFTAGSVAVIYEYDRDGEFFWVVPAPTGPTPGHRELS
nr:hypothetical protein GCM10020063_056440 [Dactylosporangium thailandense]